MPGLVTVVMPRLGESVVEGTITRWIKAQGDFLTADEPLLEVTTDKVDTEVPAPCAGRLVTILVSEGTTVAVGTELAHIETGEESTPSVPEAKVEMATPTTESSDVATDSGVRQRAGRDEGGVGVDVRAAPRGVKTPAGASAATPSPHSSDPEDGDSRLPVTSMRKSIAEHMVLSASSIPHGWTVRSVDVTPLVEYREATKADFGVQNGVRLSFQLFIIQALCAALKRHPLLNSTWAETEIVLMGRIHIGVAVAVTNGLVVPVIQNADALGFSDLALALDDVVHRARERQLKKRDLEGATFTLNNTGANGAVLSYPIIPYGQCAILTTQVILPTVVVRDGEVAIRQMMNVCMSFDHRILDGATAGAFLQDLQAQLENWTSADIRY